MQECSTTKCTNEGIRFRDASVVLPDYRYYCDECIVAFDADQDRRFRERALVYQKSVVAQAEAVVIKEKLKLVQLLRYGKV